jgi:hypothetical protein
MMRVPTTSTTSGLSLASAARQASLLTDPTWIISQAALGLGSMPCSAMISPIRLRDFCARSRWNRTKPICPKTVTTPCRRMRRRIKVSFDSRSSATTVTGPKCFTSALTMIQDWGEGTVTTAIRAMLGFRVALPR